MTLLNAALAFGALTLVVPLGIHLLFRSRYRTVDWGAMFLLRDVVRVNRRRMQWHQWVLLAIRCAIPVVLALAMARPLLKGSSLLPGDAPMSLVMVVDDSLSMQAGMRRAGLLRHSQTILDSLSERDEVLLVRSSRPDEAHAITSPRQAIRLIADLPLTAGTTGINAALQGALEVSQEASHPQRRLVMLSDFQAASQPNPAGNSDETVPDADALNRLMRKQEWAPKLDWIDLNGDERQLDNVWIEEIRVLPLAVLAGRDCQLEAVVRNDSDQPQTSVPVIWSVGDDVFHRDTADIPARSSTHVRASFVPESTGSLAVRCAVQCRDSLSADNHRGVGLRVIRQVRVWMIDGKPSAEPLANETDFLKIALSPFAMRSISLPQRPTGLETRQQDQTDPIVTRTLARRTWAKSLEQAIDDFDERPDLLVLAGVRGLPTSDSLKLLRRFVRSGGSVVFFDGAEVDREAWNDRNFLPVKLGDVISAPNRTAETNATKRSFQILAPGPGFTPWQAIASESEGLWSDVQIDRLRQADPLDSQSATTILQTTDGNVLAVAAPMPLNADESEGESAALRKATSGQIVQFMIPGNTAWGNLPLRPVFLPMMQQLVLGLAGSQTRLNTDVGQAILVSQEDASIKPNEDFSSRLRVTGPDGELTTLDAIVGSDTIPNSRSWRLPNTDLPGTYLMENEGHEDWQEVRVVSVPATESRLRATPVATLESFAASISANRHTSGDQWVAADKDDRFGSEIWRLLVYGLLAFLLLEVLWQQRVGYRSVARGEKTQTLTGASI
ncbi:MAG: BatA domain-containing protein [Planctomycetota bacterium]